MPTPTDRTLALLLRILGVALLLAFLAGLYLLAKPPAAPYVPAVLPIGNAFDDNPQIPVQEFKSKFEAGVKLMEQHEDSAVSYRKVDRWAGWASFGLTALITLLAGLGGRAVPANSAAAEVAAGAIADVKSKSKRARGARSVRRFVTAMGLLAALAPDGTGLSSKLPTPRRAAALPPEN